MSAYRILPESGAAFVSDEKAAKRPPNALADNLRASLEKGRSSSSFWCSLPPLMIQSRMPRKFGRTAGRRWSSAKIAVVKALDTKQVENELLFRRPI